MHPIARFYAKHCLIGFAAAAVFVGLLLKLNVANLWHLISTSDIGLMAVFLLWFFHGIVFAGVQTGVAVMGMAEDDDSKGGGSKAPVTRLVPVPAGKSEPHDGR